MIITGLARLGRDAEVRHTPSGDAVANLALAFNYGKRGDDGNRPTQWIDASLWGDRANKLQQYLTKGVALSVVLEDPHVETYEGKNGSGAKLVARVVSIEFAGGGQQQGANQQQGGNQQRNGTQQRGGNQQRQQQPQGGGGGGNFEDFSDDIPFASCDIGADPMMSRLNLTNW